MPYDVLAEDEAEPVSNELLEALAATLATPDGARVLAWILESLGLARSVSATERSASLHNFALSLVRLMSQASPRQTRNILWQLYLLE